MAGKVRNRVVGGASAGDCAGEGTSGGASGVSEEKEAISGGGDVLDGETEKCGGTEDRQSRRDDRGNERMASGCEGLCGGVL